MSSVEAIIFDLEGTLFNCPKLSGEHLKAIWALVAEKKRISTTESAELLTATRSELSRKFGYKPAIVTTIVALGINRNEFYHCIDRVDPSPFLPPDHEIKENLLKLSHKCKVGLLTNVSRKAINGILHALGIMPDMFDAIVAGDQVSQNKPSEEPFRKMTEILQVHPDKTLMVGDRVCIDLMTPKKLGWRTVLVGNKDVESQFVDFAVGDIREFWAFFTRLTSSSMAGRNE